MAEQPLGKSLRTVVEKYGGAAKKAMNGRRRSVTGQRTIQAVLIAPGGTLLKAKTIWKHYTRISSRNGTTKRTEASVQVTARQEATKKSGGYAGKDMSGKHWSITGQAGEPAALTALETS